MFTFETSISNLGDDVAVGDTNDHSVFGSVVLILRLDNQTLSGIIVGLTLTPPLEFHLRIVDKIMINVKKCEHHPRSKAVSNNQIS